MDILVLVSTLRYTYIVDIFTGTSGTEGKHRRIKKETYKVP